MADDEVEGMAEAVEARRKERGLSPSDLATVAGLTIQGLAPVRNGKRRQYQDRVRNGVARALAWPTDWYERLEAGEDWRTFPEPSPAAPPPPPTASDATTPELLQAVRDLTQVVRELREDMRRGRQ